MRLKIGFSWCRVEESSETEDRFLKNFLGFTVKGRFGVSKSESLYFPKSKIFPAGLASLVVRSARNQGYSVEVSNRTPLVPLPTSEFYTSSLWPHQRDGILKALEQKRGILQHATGTGKGSLISYLCKILPGRVLVVVTSKQLLHEMYDRIKLWAGEAPGRVGGGFKELGKRVVVCVQASLKTLPKRLLEAFAAIIGDEVHSAASDSYMKPLMQCTNAGIRIGLSGTPLEREDKRHLHIVGLFGEIIHRYTPKQAADDKITARATLKIVKSKVPIFYAEKYAELGNYPEWDKWAIANNRTRNLKIVDLISRTDTPFPKIVFVRTIYHQEVLKSQYGLGECPSLRYVNHKTPSEEIQDIKAGIEDGTVKVLISGPIFRQGVDMKRIATIINGAGGKATVDVIQKAGRGSRRLQDDGSHKESFLMLDFEDRGCDTPCPHKTCEWLRRHSKLRQTAYKKFGYTPQEFQ